MNFRSLKRISKLLQVQTFRGRVHIGGQEHFYMEPHAVLVVPSGEKDEMVVHTNTQDSMRVQATKDS